MIRLFENIFDRGRGQLGKVLAAGVIGGVFTFVAAQQEKGVSVPAYTAAGVGLGCACGLILTLADKCGDNTWAMVGVSLLTLAVILGIFFIASASMRPH